MHEVEKIESLLAEMSKETRKLGHAIALGNMFPGCWDNGNRPKFKVNGIPFSGPCRPHKFPNELIVTVTWVDKAGKANTKTADGSKDPELVRTILGNNYISRRTI